MSISEWIIFINLIAGGSCLFMIPLMVGHPEGCTKDILKDEIAWICLPLGIPAIIAGAAWGVVIFTPIVIWLTLWAGLKIFHYTLVAADDDYRCLWLGYRHNRTHDHWGFRALWLLARGIVRTTWRRFCEEFALRAQPRVMYQSIWGPDEPEATATAA